MRYLFLVFMAGATLFASQLTFEKGFVRAHTSVFGDSEINPSTSKITSHLKMRHSLTSLSGSIDVSLTALKSDNAKRDEHMHEAMNVEKYTKATYTITSVKKIASNTYSISGTLSLHGVKKNIVLDATLIQKGRHLHLQAKTAFNMSEFGITPPTMFFLTVKDQVEMTINTTYTIK